MASVADRFPHPVLAGGLSLCLATAARLGAETIEEVIKDPSLPSAPVATSWMIKGPVGTPLTRIVTSCGCTLVDGPPVGTLIPAQGLAVTLRTTFAVAGDHVFSASAFGPDPANPISQVTYRIRVSDLIVTDGLESPWAKLDLVPQADGTWRGMRRFRRGPHPAAWSEMTVDVPVPLPAGPGWKASVSSDPRYWELTVSADPARHCGTWGARLSCRFTSRDGAELPYRPSLRASASLPGPITAFPATIIIGGVEPGRTGSARFLLRGRPGWAGAPVRCRPPEDGGPGPAAVKATVEWSVASGAVETGRQWEGTASVQVPAGLPVGQAGGGIVIECSDGVVLRVPYLAAVITVPSP